MAEEQQSDFYTKYLEEHSLSEILEEGEQRKTNPQIINPNVQTQDGFIYVPSINLYVAKERTSHGKNWDNCHEQLQSQNLRMPTIPEFWSFVDYLKTNYPNKVEAQTILDDIFKTGNWRAEHLDAQFEKRKKEFFINSMHELK
ncbi:MAG: hypothetical protein Q7S33_01965, partial [Nanoarchaeota archaeon]|nr:hypothetical protein [Nanoarchaeota archaeon]